MYVIGVQPGTPKAKYLRMIARGGLWLSGFLFSKSPLYSVKKILGWGLYMV